jgi:cell division protein FtsL
MILSDIFTRRFRGFRIVELGGLAFFLVLALGVYMVKAGAGRDRAQIAQIERQIVIEQTRLRLLRAEVAHLEQPERIERLASAYLGMGPTSPKHEATIETLGLIAMKAPEPAPILSSVALPVEDDATEAVVGEPTAPPAASAQPVMEPRH